MLSIKFKSFLLVSMVSSACFATSVTDKDIDTQINMLYEKNPVLNEKLVHSNTKNNHVTIKGCVKSRSEKELATDLASLVEYIDSIDNQIKVDPHLHTSSNNHTHPFTQMSDLLISRLIHSKLMINPSICNSNIKVKTLNKIVILSGTASSLKEKKLAHKIALETKSVTDVVNKIKVVS